MPFVWEPHHRADVKTNAVESQPVDVLGVLVVNSAWTSHRFKASPSRPLMTGFVEVASRVVLIFSSGVQPGVVGT